ncbi:MAG TPA: hypothetical protein VID95_10405 [Candidatus Limnocylindrales bacterium]
MEAARLAASTIGRIGRAREATDTPLPHDRNSRGRHLFRDQLAGEA